MFQAVLVPIEFLIQQFLKIIPPHLLYLFFFYINLPIPIFHTPSTHNISVFPHHLLSYSKHMSFLFLVIQQLSKLLSLSLLCFEYHSLCTYFGLSIFFLIFHSSSLAPHLIQQSSFLMNHFGNFTIPPPFFL